MTSQPDASSPRDDYAATAARLQGLLDAIKEKVFERDLDATTWPQAESLRHFEVALVEAVVQLGVVTARDASRDHGVRAG
jgi:hypothetical protein